VGELTVREATAADRAALAAGALPGLAGGQVVVGHGVRYDTGTLPTFVAVRDGRIAGALSWTVDGDALEVVAIEAVRRHEGAGGALLAAAVATARRRGLRRVWLVTTNDNLDAMRFYQRRGMRMAAVLRGSVDAGRRLKPEIPAVGAYGIAMHDEVVFELPLNAG
jgi:N-acetylglutamate synthase-like GNAT family acetyltransferase